MTEKITSRIGSTIIVALLILVFTAISSGAFSTGSSVYAAARQESYELTNFDEKAVVNKDHSYDITMEITVNIPAKIDSLSIKIPNGNYKITDMSVPGTDFHMVTSDSDQMIEITSADDLRKGDHTFLIKYKIEEYADKNSESDMFYLDVLPPDWEVPIGKFKFTLILPEDFPWSDLQYYAGQYGVQDVSGTLSYKADGNRVVLTGSRLPADFGITFKAELPDGYWVDPLDNNWTVSFAGIMLLAVLTLILIMWLIGGRDPKFSKKRISHPIPGITSADEGYLFNGHIRVRDVIPLLMRLGMDGSLRISEYEPRKYRLYRLEEPPISEERYIRNIYTTLFEGVYKGRAIEMEDIGRRLMRVIRDVELSVASGYSAKDMRACTTLSRIFRLISMIMMSVAIGSMSVLADLYQYRELSAVQPLLLAVLSFVTLWMITSRFDMKYDMEHDRYVGSMVLRILMFGAVAAYAGYDFVASTGSVTVPVMLGGVCAISIVLICIMKARARGNAKIVNKILGVRNFMETADSKELYDLQSEDPDYYYNMLQYAFSFSLVEKWAAKFRFMGVEPPSWYSDDTAERMAASEANENMTTEIARRLSQFTRTMESGYRAMRRGRRRFR
jgi:hypothetical protein